MKKIILDNNTEYTLVSERMIEFKKLNLDHDFKLITTHIESLNAWKVDITLCIYQRTTSVCREYPGSSMKIINENDPYGRAALEWAQTAALGRALGLFGIGIDGGMASYEEVVAVQKTKKEKGFVPVPITIENVGQQVESIVQRVKASKGLDVEPIIKTRKRRTKKEIEEENNDGLYHYSE